MSVGRLLDISVRTMQTYQAAMDVTSNNISNANNADYTRQKVLFGTVVGENGVGIGVKLQDVVRIRESLIDQQVRKYQSSLSDSSKRSDILKNIEAIINEPSEEGMSNYMAEFFNSWDALSANPTSTQLRLNVIQKSQQLSEKMKDTIYGFSEIQNSLLREGTEKVTQINTYLQNVHTLNQQIYEAEARGMRANELMDERDAQIDKLSGLVNITVTQNEYGSVMVNVGGMFGSDRTNYNEFEAKVVDGKLKLVVKSDANSVAVVNSGELAAIADLYSNKIPGYKASYEKLAQNFVEQVNALHMTGYTLSTGGVSSTGIPFFGELDTDGNVINAFVDGQMVINSAILNDPKKIAASGANGNDGNNTIANGIAGLSKAKISGLNDQTIGEYYSSIMNTIGLDKTVADNSTTSRELVMQNLQTQKSSTSGVSLDEEMTNIIKYQRSYEASAKLITIADELLQTIIDMVR